MNAEINCINQTLPTIRGKTGAIRQWTRAIGRLDHYKAAYHALLKEATTLLEFALWKANLEGDKGVTLERDPVRANGKVNRARQAIRVTSDASIVIKNVLHFLALI